MKYSLILMWFCLLFMLPLFDNAVSAQTIEGSWLNYDPRNDKPLSVVEIYRDGDSYYGRIVTLYQHPHNDPNPICTKCSGKRKNQPWIGLVILENFQKNGDQYEGGTLLIPKYGVSLPCVIKFDPMNPNLLTVVGKVGFISKSSQWTRIAAK